jgi:hypothetical protein
MPRVKLASERVSPTSQAQAGGITPTLLGGSLSSASPSVGSIRAPRIDPTAGQVKFTPVPVPQINVSTALESAQNLAGVWTKSAFDYQNREDDVRAQEAVLKVSDALQKSFYGGVDADGNAVKGYSSTEGIAASDSYDGYLGGMNKAIMDVVGGYSPAVQQKAMLRIADLQNTYKTRAAKHRSDQLRVAEQNNMARGINSLLVEAEKDPQSLFNLNPVTGLRRIDEFTGRHSNTFLEKQELQKALISGVFDTIRFKEGTNAVQAYKEASEWYEKNKDFMLEIPQRDIQSKLGVMARAAETKAKELNTEALKKQKQDVLNAGGDLTNMMLRSGEFSYTHLVNFVNTLNTVYDGDFEAADDKMLEFVKAAAKDMSLDPKLGYETAVEQVQKFAQFAEKNGIQLFNKLENRNDLAKFLADDLQKYVEDVQGAQDKASDDAELGALNVLYDNQVLDKIYGDPNKGQPGRYYVNDSQIMKDFPQLQALQGDSEKVAEEKRKIRENIVKASELRYESNKVALVDTATKELRERHARGAAFASEADLNKFLLDRNIINQTDRNQVIAVRDRLMKEDEAIVNQYTQGVIDQIKFTFKPDLVRAMTQAGKGELAPGVMMELMSKAPIHPVGQNIINQIERIADENIPVHEREAKIQELLISYTDKVQSMAPEGIRVRDFQHALQIEAAESKIDRYVSYGDAVMATGQGNVQASVPPEEADTTVINNRPSAGVTSDMLLESYINDYFYGQ